MRFVIIFMMLVLVNPLAVGRDLDGRYAQSPLKPWFDSLKNQQNMPCCSDADGNVLKEVDWESQDGRFRVRVDGKWIDVPPEAVLNQPNLFGQTMVWLTWDRQTVRCFIPGAGG